MKQLCLFGEIEKERNVLNEIDFVVWNFPRLITAVAYPLFGLYINNFPLITNQLNNVKVLYPTFGLQSGLDLLSWGDKKYMFKALFLHAGYTIA